MERKKIWNSKIWSSKKEYDKQYAIKNKEKLKTYAIEHKEERNEWYRKYNHTPKRQAYLKEYFAKNHERLKKYYQDNKEKIKKRSKVYSRNSVLRTIINGEIKVITRLQKRSYTNYCEICLKSQENKLAYHHWDDNNPSLGIWSCIKCHGLAEAVDIEGYQQRIERYLKLKEQIEKEKVI
jgi:hypothetical protein